MKIKIATITDFSTDIIGETDAKGLERIQGFLRRPDALPDVERALQIAREDGGIDGAHHKMWVIDQMVRALTGDRYAAFVEDARRGEDGPETYSWNEGIAP